MLRPGDWITMPKYGADGHVTEVTLTTVKVCNFDKTITTIPPYALVSDSFQNWRGMREAGGRRIKRSIMYSPFIFIKGFGAQAPSFESREPSPAAIIANFIYPLLNYRRSYHATYHCRHDGRGTRHARD